MNIDVIDHIVNEEIEKLASIVENLSVDAQTAYIPSIEELELKKDKDFAAILWDPKIGSLRKFANFTSGLTEINMSFLVDVKDKLPEEVVKVAAMNLTCAANKFKLPIPKELEIYKSAKFVNNLVDLTKVNKATYLNKKAEKVDNVFFALTEKKQYPINTEMELKKAATFFDKNYKKLGINDKLEFIKNASERAKTLKVSLSKTAIEKLANLSKDIFNEEFYNHIQVRKSYLKDSEEELKIAYDELLSRADELGSLDSAYVLEELDKTAQLNNNYGKGIEDPLLSTLGNEKLAGREVDGIFVTHDNLKKIDEGVLTSLVGNDVIKELKSDSGLDVFESLPKPIRSDILQHIEV